MNLTLFGHEDRYPVEQLLLSLFPAGAEVTAVSRLSRGKAFLTAWSSVTVNGRTHRASKRLLESEETVRLRRRVLQQSMFLAALPLLEEAPPWGALAGVRPTKLTTKLLLQGNSPKKAQKTLETLYYVTPARAKLAVDCSVSTKNALEKTEEKDLSLYIGIPFCPTRCAYCSFVSRSIGQKQELMEPYLQGLFQEIAFTGRLLAHSGLRVRTVYMGGGTPTTLTEGQMQGLLQAIYDHFDLSGCIEFTVEGGRPDTLSPEKLRAIRAAGPDRMSINPQSMNDGVLRASGRPHTAADVEAAFAWARDGGFENVNMDLIAGLPTDTVASFRASLDRVAALGPENITVHTLALKKGADLFARRELLPPGEAVAEMLAYAEGTLRALGYRPYYLYRQKYMSGSFENVGWSRAGRDCLYNIYMMEELHSILSLGAGGMSKRNLPDGTLRRFPNPKFPEQYLQLLHKVLEEKRGFFEEIQRKGSI